MKDLFRDVAVSAARSTAFSRFLDLLEAADRERPELLRVLTYHRVDDPEANPTLAQGLVSATPAVFDQQMGFLAQHYRVVSMPEVVDAYRRRRALPPRSVLLTFDDAYQDFAEHAWPVLKRYRLPVTLFVPTAFPDHPERAFWWDRLYQAVNGTNRQCRLDTPFGPMPLATAPQRRHTYTTLVRHAKSLPHHAAMAFVDHIIDELGGRHAKGSVLDWGALRRLAREGVTLGAHTRTHPLMNRVSVEEACSEAVESLHDLEREIGDTSPVFAYPSGGFNDEVVQGLEREGFALAFTTVRGINDMRCADRLRLRRINVGRRTIVPVLRAQLLSQSVGLSRWR